MNTDNNPLFSPGEYKNQYVVSDTLLFTSGNIILEIRSGIFHCPTCNKLTMHIDNGTGTYECTNCTIIH